MWSMVCFCFIVDGFESMWSFISAQKEELTDFSKNQLMTASGLQAMPLCFKTFTYYRGSNSRTAKRKRFIGIGSGWTWSL
jgi:hypothetical protein